MLALPSRLPVAPPEQRHHLLGLAGPKAPMVREICSIPGAGISSLKMIGDLGAAIGVAVNLESHALDNRARRRTVERIGRILLREDEAQTMLSIAESLRRSLNLLHLPIGGIGFDLHGTSVVEFKSYFRTHLSRERLDGGARQFDQANRDDIAWAVSDLRHILAENRIAAAGEVISTMRRAGAGLEMLGVDFGGHVDIKLYFTPPRHDRRFMVDMAIGAVAAAAGAVGIAGIVPHASDLIAFGHGLGLDCNQIAVELPGYGAGEVKIYQDSWNMDAGAPLEVERDRAVEAVRLFYDRAGTEVDNDSIAALFRSSYGVGCVLDGIAVDYSLQKRHAKTYLRSSLDAGMGVALGVEG